MILEQNKQRKQTPTVWRALAAPFQRKGWLQRILPLALLQLIPLVGQMILFGYGLAVVRGIYAGDVALPRLHWHTALREGALFFGLGLLYLAPLLGLIPNIVLLEVGLRFLGVVPAFGSVGALAIQSVWIALLSLLTLLIFTGLHLSAVRYAVEGQGIKALLNPTSEAKMLWHQRALAGRMLLNLLLLLVGALAVAAGLVLLVVPSLVALVILSIVLWHLFAHYAMSLGIEAA